MLRSTRCSATIDGQKAIDPTCKAGAASRPRRGREFCGRKDQHPYELFLQLEGIAHRTTRVGRPQSNGIVERLHRTLLDEHLRVQGRTVRHETVEEMQTALDAWRLRYNQERPHQGRGMNGRTPLQAFSEGLPAKEQQAMPETQAA